MTARQGPWTVAKLHEALEGFEAELRGACLEESSIRTYVDRSRVLRSVARRRLPPPRTESVTPTRSLSPTDSAFGVAAHDARFWRESFICERTDILYAGAGT